MLAALEVGGDLVLSTVQLSDLLGHHEQFHVRMAVQPKLEGFLEDRVGDVDFEDVSCTFSYGLKHEAGNCFISFAVLYYLCEIGTSLDSLQVDLKNIGCFCFLLLALLVCGILLV